MNCGKVSLVGTSGGAWAGINAALKRPDLIHKVVADSFDGLTLQDHFAANVAAERTGAKRYAGWNVSTSTNKVKTPYQR